MKSKRVQTPGTRRIAAALAVLLLLLTMFVQVAAAQSATPAASPVASPVVIGDPVRAGAAWLVDQQLEDGSFPGFSGTADVGTTTDSVIALAAASAQGADVDEALASALSYLAANGADYAKKGAGQAAKLAIAIDLAEGDVSTVGGANLSDQVLKAPVNAAGVYGTGIFDHAYVMIAMTALGADVPSAAIDALASAQIADGSWGFDGKTTAGNGDTNTTALVVQALVAAGESSNPIVARALAYLQSTQLADGSFPYQGGAGAVGDSNSTANVVQAIIAAGQDPASAKWRSAAAALDSFQNADGAFRYQNVPPDDNLFSTVQAIPALAGYDLGSLIAGEVDATPVAA